ncbi:hypothetical protein F5146DRAFT_1041721 [Armillaria mellea]|nr:hypothetical protein F5146DRAFT_1041721 [Armillaria mellea]
MSLYSSILAPVRRLPIDVLKSVFHEMQILQRQSRSGYSGEGLDLSQGPWTLSHVCGAWRDIVLSYPQLWSHIALCLRSEWGVCCFGPATTKHTTRHMLVALEAIILRSDQCPLDIVLSRDVEGRNLDTSMTDKVFAMILEVSHRWRTLVVHWISLDFIERLKVVRGRIPYLESLTWGTSNGADLPEDIRIVFSDAPCLRKAILQGTCNLKNLLLPPHITHLAARVESVSNLGIYQSLVECHLELQPRRGIDSDTSLIFLPNVQRLFVTSLPVLAHLCLPSLNDLTITVVGVNNQQAIQLVNDFLHRSRCDLTRLASFNRGNEILVHESLLSMDTLVCLTMRLNWNDDNIINIINVLASDRFLRNLQHLRLFGSITSSSQYLLTAVIRCHRRHLRSVKFYCSTPAEVEIVDKQLASMQGPGQQFIALLERTWQGHRCQFGKFSLPV